MAEAKNSFIKSKMNKDLDERLIPNNEYRDALNIAISRSENSDVGAVESILGNSTTGVTPSSGHIIIGVYEDEANNRLYYFRTNYFGTDPAPLNALCSIGYVNILTNNNTELVSGSFLNFSGNNDFFMSGISLIENQLFFTDNRNQPRKINVDKPLGYYTNEDQISVAKFAPYSPPSFINMRAGASYYANFQQVLKPSTMSDAADPPVVEIGIYKISQENLAVKKYRNGDAIPEAQNIADWTTADQNQQGRWCYYANYNGNGVTYGLLYNKWAVIDPRGLAPVGHRIPTLAEWNGIIGTAGSAASIYKSQFLWASGAGDDQLGTDVLPAGYRNSTTSPDPQGFLNLTTETRFWTSDAYDSSNPNANAFVKFNTTNAIDTTGTSATVDGYSVRVLRNTNYTGWNGDPDYLSERFVRFSYRFKFDDNEYSTIAPFSQDVFIPYQEGEFVNDDENQAFITSVVEFMQNSINNAVLNIELPCIDIINKYKVKAIDIIYKQSDTQAYQVIETVKVDSSFINSLNNTNIYQYSYQSTIPITTLPAIQTTRVFDKVPVKALAQETSGNRIMYANYLEGHSAPNGLDYYVGVADKSAQQFIEYPQHSVKQNRNYQVGIVLSDKYGRQTDVVLSNYDGVLDSNGDPQPGSNFYHDYKPISFSNSLQPWTGDTLTLNYLQQIPEGDIGISGYPGAYAQGNYYEVDTETANPPSALYAYFRSLGTECIIATANQTVFSTTILYADANSSDNTFRVLVDSGNGWILQASTSYTIANSNNYVQITFSTGIPVGDVVKFEVLYTSENLYKYDTGASSSTNRPLFPDFPSTYADYYAVGKKLKGLYIDYTEITSVTAVSDSNGVRGVEFFTKEEVATNYLFDNTPGTRPEPSKLGQTNTYATYDINVLGFYIYKSVVKQQQQDYYNVYLPGIINGYPIKGETKEQNEVGFISLVNDNINKVPRNLQDVGPQQNQFTSDVAMWPRVTNINEVASTTVTYSTFNKQIDPEASSDQVDLVGGIQDLFPGLQPTNPPTIAVGEINFYSIYSYETKPFIAKISTQKAVGLKEGQYTVPTQGSGNFPYSPDLGLAVYETAPYVSPLELFYESSTSSLISELNLDIENENTNITGLSNFTYGFFESMASGVAITTDFFPTAGGQNLTNTTLAGFTCFSYFSSGPNIGQLDSSTSQANRFTVETGAQTGSYVIKTNDRFYAGATFESDSVATRGKFLFTFTFVQIDGVQVDQSTIIQLENTTPICTPAVVYPTVTSGQGGIVTHTSGANQSMGGENGSARANSLNDSAPTKITFSSSNFTSGWTIDSAVKTNSGTGVTQTITETSTPLNLSQVFNTYQNSSNFPTYQDGQAISGSGDQVFFSLTAKPNANGQFPGWANEPGNQYEIYMNLTDTLGAQSTQQPNGTSAKIEYYVGAYQGTGVIINLYNNSGANAGSDGSSSFSGAAQNQYYQIQNWTPNKVYLYIKAAISSSIQSSSSQHRTVAGGRFGDNTTGGTDAQGNTYTFIPNATANSNFSNPPSSPTATMATAPVTFAVLQPFTAASGGLTTSEFNTARQNGLKPGMKNTNTPNYGSYDYSGCALVNLQFQQTPGNATTVGAFDITYSTTQNAPLGSTISITNPNNTTPFYADSGGSVPGYPTDFGSQFVGPA